MSKWDNRFLELTEEIARWSKDSSTKVGAIITLGNQIVSTGFNGFPSGIEDTPDRWLDRDTKLELVIHAELNAILQAAKLGVPIKGGTMYISATNSTGTIWGGPPCHRCVVHVIQSGICRVVTRPMKNTPSRWRGSLEKSMRLLEEAGVEYVELVE
jgi:dCMP deaminase